MITLLQIYTWCSSVNIKKSLLNYFRKRKLLKMPINNWLLWWNPAGVQQGTTGHNPSRSTQNLFSSG